MTADLQSAMVPDGLASSHPIFVPVSHPDEINEIFDQISYKKVRDSGRGPGGVQGMRGSGVGPEVGCRGVRMGFRGAGVSGFRGGSRADPGVGSRGRVQGWGSGVGARDGVQRCRGGVQGWGPGWDPAVPGAGSRVGLRGSVETMGEVQ